jgi:RNA polymerase sigma factor (sigma-70 family)
MGQRMSDEELLRTIGRDPETGIRQVLLGPYGAQLLGRLRKHARDRRYGNANVEDVFQRAVLRLLKPEVRAEIIAAGGGMVPYLSRWGYWRLDDLARAHAAETQRSSAPADSVDPQTPSGAARAVGAVFERLSPRDRMILRWRYADRLPNAEVGERLGIGEGAAKKAAHDARGRLRKLLEEAGIRYDRKEVSP